LSQLEEKEAEEVLEQPIPGVTVRNIYFDRTPAKLVTKVITEQGLMGKQEVRQMALRAVRNQQMLDRTIPM